MAYRRPGVYLEESLLVNPSDVSSTTTVGCFVGVAQKGQLNEPILIESWSDYVTLFGGFEPIQPPTSDPNDRTAAVFGGQSFAALPALKADPTVGDGYYVGVAFDAGDFVTLGDDTQAHYLLPVLSTNRATAAAGQMYAPDPDITASDASNAGKLAATTNEVQSIAITGTPTGGTFTLKLLTDRLNNGQGVTTGTIAYNATAAAVKSVIDAAIAGNTIATAGGPFPGTPVTLTYTGMGDVSPAVATANLTGGTNAAVTVTTTTAGVGQGFVATPATAWTTGQSMWIGPYAFNWNGTAWVAGAVGGGIAKSNSGVWTSGRYPGTPDSPAPPPKVLSYLPYSVYSFFQNGGRFCYIIRSAPTGGLSGVASSISVNGAVQSGNLTSFLIQARSVGTWGNDIQYSLTTQDTVDFGAGRFEDVFAIQVLIRNANGDYETVETFSGLSVTGNPSGSRRVDSTINDLYAGSRYIRISSLNPLQAQPDDTQTSVSLAGGVDPGIPDAGALRSSAQKIGKVEGPINLNIVGYLNDASLVGSATMADAWVSTAPPVGSFTDREDVVIINDSAEPRSPNETSTNYAETMKTQLGANAGDSYTVAYGPWIIIPDPRRVGSTLIAPPGGAVMGMMARIDATIGVFRAPAGVIAGLSNAVGVQTRFTDTELGDLNNKNINIIRSVVGAGICVMGARTRKSYGVDKYISARRTLIAIKESLRQSTQWAVFENNDNRLWSGLRMTADRILRPMWEAGGLAGVSTADAYYIKCDSTLNTPSVIQSGEVRMEIGVALEYPAEFVVIRITQFDRGSSTSEINPSA